MRFTLPTPGRRLTGPGVALAIAGLAVLGAGCAPEPSAEPSATPSSAPQPVSDSGLGVTELPAVEKDPAGTCPYLDTQWVAEANGQKVTAIGVDNRFDTPACVFWSYPEEPQLTVMVRHMASPEEAMAVVDWAAPIDYTDPASEPEGWNGGRHGGGAVPERIGAAYSVAKGPVAVTVFTNQNESVKAQVVAEQVIANLNL
ncbi:MULTISPECIES: DUF2020 domain-containing protein [Corynebacterium]|uniref:DUF2020 domain-containing protein n=1 Tax=Corynebacterium TaxID=1716 RepID=UPI00223A7E6E|nr:DUF2020 domain-containing protein [Corynebacterium sanguinis]MCT1463162.1 DUF2020 domain-containing protein [Corynebacterium sanguinis]MCT1695921.1 DUF2020 domain-containing protein [Corynebacterium sanguinis]MCT1715329.1 DUF2020 domain-containing protein [Corynebacterium sanguinis]MCT2252477.1 DUF2020 domain-containing protein [Corynebacterium sanguinis]MCT2329903.1 DUF2020 domain-containing protein [Corynebacterium sanguinis]